MYLQMQSQIQQLQQQVSQQQHHQQLQQQQLQQQHFSAASPASNHTAPALGISPAPHTLAPLSLGSQQAQAQAHAQAAAAAAYASVMQNSSPFQKFYH
jgi:hypothetical protein